MHDFPAQPDQLWQFPKSHVEIPTLAHPHPIIIILEFSHTEAMNHLPGMIDHGLTN